MNPVGDDQPRTSEDSTGQILSPTGSSHDGAFKYRDFKGITKVTEYHVSYSMTEAKSPRRERQ